MPSCMPPTRPAESPAWLAAPLQLPPPHTALDERSPRNSSTNLPRNYTLAMGVLTGKYQPGDRPKGIRRFGRYFRGDGLKKAQPVVALLGEIGERYSKTPAQVALRWLIEKENALPTPGAKNGRQAAGNAEALSFTLVAGEIQGLDQTTTAWRR